MDKIFNVDGWGQVGEANLAAFAPNPGFKDFRDLEVNEVTEGKIMKPGSDKEPERVTRIR